MAILSKQLIWCLALVSGAATAHTYVFHDLGPLNRPPVGAATGVRDLNNHGQVVGSAIATDGYQQATLWQGNSRTTLGRLSGPTAEALAVNNAGKVVGWATLNTRANGLDFDQRATLWINGDPIDLGTLGGNGSIARDINDRGHIVGHSYIAGRGIHHAALWTGGTPIDLNPAGDTSDAFGINDADVIVGSMEVQVPESGVYGIRHATRWNGTVATDLGTLGGLMSEAYAINNAGVVVGYAHTADLKDHATVWTGNTPTDLHAASASDSAGFAASLAYNINNAGQIVGERDTATSDRRATLWQGNTATDLNDEIDQAAIDAGWILRNAQAISEDGCIVGLAENSATGASDPHAYLLVPVGAPPPSGVQPANAEPALNVQPLATADATSTPTTMAGGGGATGLIELTSLAALWLLVSPYLSNRRRRLRK